jgi:hypothetical protein
LPDRCVDCGTGPSLHTAVSCFTETFPVTGPNGLRYHLTLRLCLACGSRFADRLQVREYLRTRIPVHATTVVEAAAVAV